MKQASHVKSGSASSVGVLSAAGLADLLLPARLVGVPLRKLSRTDK